MLRLALRLLLLQLLQLLQLRLWRRLLWMFMVLLEVGQAECQCWGRTRGDIIIEKVSMRLPRTPAGLDAGAGAWGTIGQSFELPTGLGFTWQARPSFGHVFQGRAEPGGNNPSSTVWLTSISDGGITNMGKPVIDRCT